MDAVEEIKQRLSIEDVVGEYVQLKRAGRNWKGLSPFSNERTPSFMVSPEKQIWHDFSSGKGGNMFGFVMEMEGLDFKGALELLARKAGLDIDQFRTRPGGSRGKEKERLYELLDIATKFYQVQFSRNAQAYEYVLKTRGFSKDTALAWRLGYSPNNGTALVDFLHKKGFTPPEMKAAGVSAQRYRGGVGDMFRGRVMIPLCDQQGRVIGFTARLLADDPNAPKYINTPQTVLYDKSRHIFGLHFAKEAIRKIKYVVVAEGNLDVITSYQAGVRQVVATAGTALTEGHLKGLSRFTGDIRLSFDADAAGLNASERAIPLASKVGVSLSVVTISGGKDPDELIRQDPDAWQKAIAAPQYALDWLIARYCTQLDITSAQGKRQFSDIILQVVRGLQDHIEQEHYIEEVGRIIGVSKDAMMLKFHQTKESRAPAPLKKPRVPQEKPDKATLDYAKTQNHLLALTLVQPGLRDTLAVVTPDMLLDEAAQVILAFLREHPQFDGHQPEVAKLKPYADYVKMLSLLYEELYQGLEITELRYEATRLQAHLIERYVKTKKKALVAALQTSTEAETRLLLEEAKQLDYLLKTHKGGA